MQYDLSERGSVFAHFNRLAWHEFNFKCVVDNTWWLKARFIKDSSLEEWVRTLDECDSTLLLYKLFEVLHLLLPGPFVRRE